MAIGGNDRLVQIVLRAKDEATKTILDVSGGLRGPLIAAATAATAAFAAMAGAAIGAAQFLKSAAEEAAQAEVAQARLAVALRNSGQELDKALPALNAQAKALQKSVGVSDDYVRSIQTLLVSLGQLSGDALERATAAAINFSIVTGRDAESAATALAKAAEGQTAGLMRLGIVLDETTPKGQEFAAALAIMEQRFGGTAEAMGGALLNRLNAVGEAMGEIREAIGGIFTNSGTLKTALGEISSLLFRLADYIEQNRDALEEWVRSGIMIAAEGILGFSVVVGKLIEVFYALRVALSWIKAEFAGFAESTLRIASLIRPLDPTLGALADAFSDMSKKAMADADALAAKWEERAQQIGAAIGAIYAAVQNIGASPAKSPSAGGGAAAVSGASGEGAPVVEMTTEFVDTAMSYQEAYRGVNEQLDRHNEALAVMRMRMDDAGPAQDATRDRLIQIKEQIIALEDPINQLMAMGELVAGALERAFNSFLDGILEGELNMKQILKNLLKDLVKAIADFYIKLLLQKYILSLAEAKLQTARMGSIVATEMGIAYAKAFEFYSYIPPAAAALAAAHVAVGLAGVAAASTAGAGVGSATGGASEGVAAGGMAMARGGIVPGSGYGDHIPALLEPGESVLTRSQTERILDGRAAIVPAGGGSASIQMQNIFNGASSQGQVDDLIDAISRAVETRGFRLVSTRLATAR